MLRRLCRRPRPAGWIAGDRGVANDGPVVRRLAIGTLLAAAASVIVLAGASMTSASERGSRSRATEPARTVSIDRPVSARELGLPADAGPRLLARTVLRERARRLGLRSARDLKFEYALPNSRARGRTVRHLVYRQTSGGLPVAWSELVVHVTRGRVLSINGSTVPTRGRLVRAGAQGIGAREAEQIARARVTQAEQTLHTQRVAWAGSPGTRRARVPREAFLVQVDQALGVDGAPGGQDPQPGAPPVNGAPADDLAGSFCVVVDRATGRVLATWAGYARDPKRPPGGRSAKPDGARASLAQAPTPGDLMWLAVIDMNHQADSHKSNLSAYPFNFLFLDGGFPGSDKIINANLFVGRQGFTDPDVLHVQANARFYLKQMCNRLGWCFPRNNGSLRNWRVIGEAELGDSTLGLWRIHSDGFSHIYIDPSASFSPSVLTHEISHDLAVTMIGDQVNSGQPGTVGEALADIGGYLISDSRLQQEHIPGVPQLSMDNPPLNHVNQFQCNGSIHANAGILNLAFIRSVDATSPITMREVYKKVIYERRLTAFSGLMGFRREFVRAANERFGAATRLKLNDAFNSVGLRENTPDDLNKGC